MGGQRGKTHAKHLLDIIRPCTDEINDVATLVLQKGLLDQVHALGRKHVEVVSLTEKLNGLPRTTFLETGYLTLGLEDLDTSALQKLDDLNVPLGVVKKQKRWSKINVCLGAPVKKDAHGRQMSSLASAKQGSVFHRVERVDVDTVVEEHQDVLVKAVLGSKRERAKSCKDLASNIELEAASKEIDVVV
jgi:hypothetical protein